MNVPLRTAIPRYAQPWLALNKAVSSGGGLLASGCVTVCTRCKRIDTLGLEYGEWR